MGDLEEQVINYYKNIFDNIPENIKEIKIDVGTSYEAFHSKDWVEKSKDLFVFGFEPCKESRDSFEEYLEKK